MAVGDRYFYHYFFHLGSVNVDFAVCLLSAMILTEFALGDCSGEMIMDLGTQRLVPGGLSGPNISAITGKWF